MSRCHKPDCLSICYADMKAALGELSFSTKKAIDNETNSRVAQVDVIHKHIEKLHGLIDIEDRITASDVLCRLTQLETSVDFEKAKELIYQGAQTHASILKLKKRLTEIERHFSGDYQLIASKLNPHKCPVCEGLGIVLTEAAKVDFDGMLRAGLEKKKRCNPCDGKGIVWG